MSTLAVASCGLDGLSANLIATADDPLQPTLCPTATVQCDSFTQYRICPNGDLSEALNQQCEPGSFCIQGNSTPAKPCTTYTNSCQEGEPVRLDQDFLSFESFKPSRDDVQLRNCGPAELTISHVEVIDQQDASGHQVFSFAINNNMASMLLDRDIDTVIAPNESIELSVNYNPEEYGAIYHGTLVVEATVNDAQNGVSPLKLRIPIQGHSPSVETLDTTLESQTLNFSTSLGSTSVQSLSLSNHNTVPLAITPHVEARVGASSNLIVQWPELPQKSLLLRSGVDRALLGPRSPTFWLDPNSSQSFSAVFQPDNINHTSVIYRLEVLPWPKNTPYPRITLEGDVDCALSPEPHIALQQVVDDELVALDRRNVPPMTRLRFDAADSFAQGDTDIHRYNFTLQKPDGSAASLLPITDDTNDLYVDLVGEYTVSLEVRDGYNRRSCELLHTVVDVQATADLHAQLTWITPGDPNASDTGTGAGADLDLHIRREKRPDDAAHKFTDDYDCFHLNPNPNWGEPNNTRDDCVFLRDDNDGWGPEIAHIQKLEDRYFDIEVHAKEDHGYGESIARLDIFFLGDDGFEHFSQTKTIAEGSTWHVARIWSSHKEVEIIDKTIE